MGPLVALSRTGVQPFHYPFNLLYVQLFSVFVLIFYCNFEIYDNIMEFTLKS